MKRHHLMIPLLAANLMTFGCAGMNDQERTRAEGTTAGAVIGSLLGYAIGEERGAAVGAALGAGAGYAIGNEVAKRKQAYASTEDFLDGEIARIQEFNQTTVAYNQQVRAEIARLQAEAGRMQRRVASGEMARAELQGERNAIAQRLEKSEALEKSLARELEVQQRILAEERGDRPYNDRYLAQLTKEVAELQRNLNQLRDDSAQLASIDGRLSV
ncbi:glycine zipper domain-containing protein [Halomonas cerina]|uniref:Outer membrane lipoprotein SlyB n=1 Tax=Halomonas cerina TaxID=447424 RepID=A0A839VGE1_9GAMM|nr:glycine zipper domain-containing protein [Halomonas cerina]MBB3192399.1 outer membrane lipoprotein SlyB [Halomonas cerina]